MIGLENIGNLTGRVKQTGTRHVAEGGSSLVWRGQWVDGHNNQQVLAIKVVKITDPQITQHQLMERLNSEIQMWKRLSHPNILELYGTATDEQFGPFPALVAPWCHHGSLRDLLESMEGGVGRSLRYKIIIGFSEGLAHMHSAPDGPVMHGDLKAANIFIAEGFVPKIADFGLSRTAPRPQNQTTMQVQGPGTWRWMTPEAHRRLEVDTEPERPTRQSDIWSWAHVVYETITGQIPYPQHRGDFPIHNAIISGELNPKPATDLLKSDAVLVSHFWPLLLRCWSMDPKGRPAIVDILRGPPFSKIQLGGNDPLDLRQDPARYGSARQYQKLGDTAFRNEAYKEALDYYDQARLTFDLLGDTSRTANCHRDLGWTCLRLRQAISARQHFDAAESIYKSLNDFEALLEILQDKGITERMAGHSQASREYFEMARKDCRAAGLYVKEGWCIVAAGLLDVDAEDWVNAHRCFKAGVAIAIREGSQGLLARSHERQGDCYMRENRRADARKSYDEAAKAYRRLPGEGDQVDRVEQKIQGCHRIRHEDITAMPLWGIGDLRQPGVFCHSEGVRRSHNTA